MDEIANAVDAEDLAAELEALRLHARSLEIERDAQRDVLRRQIEQLARAEAEIQELKEQLEEARAPRPPIDPEERDGYVHLELERAIASQQAVYAELESIFDVVPLPREEQKLRAQTERRFEAAMAEVIQCYGERPHDDNDPVFLTEEPPPIAYDGLDAFERLGEWQRLTLSLLCSRTVFGDRNDEDRRHAVGKQRTQVQVRKLKARMGRRRNIRFEKGRYG